MVVDSREIHVCVCACVHAISMKRCVHKCLICKFFSTALCIIHPSSSTQTTVWDKMLQYCNLSNQTSTYEVRGSDLVNAKLVC
jgi:hypothetical protein